MYDAKVRIFADRDKISVEKTTSGRVRFPFLLFRK